MPERQDIEALLRENLGTVDRICASLCRRHGLVGDEADDFCGWVKLRLVENDYAILQKFRGESALATYLTVVIAMLFREYRVHEWGRWRHSAAARRLGKAAMRLELLLYRDGCTLAQAAQILRAEGHHLTDAELRALLAQLPPRSFPRPVEVGSDSLEATPAPARADDRVEGDEADRARRTIEESLLRALERLPDEDRLIVRMRVWEAMSLADVARVLKLPQKPLYRRWDRILATLRKGLVADGVSPDDIRGLLDRP